MRILDGKAIVITGAGRGLGRAYALACAREGAGVLVNDVDVPEAKAVAADIEAAGGTAIISHSDIGDVDKAREMIDTGAKALGRLDGLVNNAAVYDITTAGTTPDGVADRALRVNVLGTIACFDAALPHLRRTRGSVVNVTSGAQCGMPRLPVYGATKGAVASLTYAWAGDLDGQGVRVNAISPTAATRMVAMSQAEGLPGIDSTAAPDHVAPLVVYLLSELAADVNGQIFRFDRGELSVMAHPHVREPAVYCAEWSPQDVSDAVAGLSEQFMPPGVVRR